MFHPPVLTQSIIPAVMSFHFEAGRFNPAPLSLSTSTPPHSLSYCLSLTLSPWASLQTWELWVPMLWISSVTFSGMMRTPAAPSTAEWFSSHSFFLSFCCGASNVEINQIPCFNFFHKKETNWNEELELCFKHGLIISTETVFWRKERVLSESRASLRRFLINLKNQTVSN